MDQTFIDWIRVCIVIPGLPQINDGHVSSVSPDGELQWLKAKRLGIRSASWETHTNLCSTETPFGNGIVMDGNPTKYLQGHNLTGSSDLAGLVQAWYNQIAADHPALGLPQIPRFGKEIDLGFSRIDLTRMYRVVLSDDPQKMVVPQSFIDICSRFARSRVGTGIRHGNTLYFNKDNSRYWRLKMYSKFEEYDKNRVKVPLLANNPHLLRYAAGALRVEVELRRRGLDLMKPHEFLNLHDVFEKHLGRITMGTAHTITDQAITDLPRSVRGTYYDWLHGLQIEKNATWYRHRRRLLDALGIDISAPNPNPDSPRPESLNVKLVPHVPPPELADLTWSPNQPRLELITLPARKAS